MSNKETLIKLAQDKGFKSQIFTDTEWLYSSKEDLRYYLWMCELYKWLADNYTIGLNLNNSEMEANLLKTLEIICQK